MILHWWSRLKLPFLILVNFIQIQNGTVLANILDEGHNLNSPNLKSRDSHVMTHTKCVNFDLRSTLCLHSNRPSPKDLMMKYGLWPNLKEFLDKGGSGGFVDLTRLGKHQGELHSISRSDSEDFAEDYLDIGDLWSITARREMVDDRLSELARKVNMNDDQKEYNSLKSIVFTVFRALAQPGESSESDSDEKPKRFEVIENLVDPQESQSESSEELKPVKMKKVKYIYTQGPTRHLTFDLRRRLPYFLPKRYHWSEDDLKELPTLWFSGPQGQYAGVYRKPF